MKSVIVQVGDGVLREKAKPVAKKDVSSRKIQSVITIMRKALAPEENGVAIAAPQIGEPLRIFIVAGKVFEAAEQEDPDAKKLKDKVFINPEFLRVSRKKNEMSEGCLSVRGVYGLVLRHDKASIKALNERGESITYHGSGLLAQIFQHEMDHLDGVLFVDKVETITEGAELLTHGPK